MTDIPKPLLDLGIVVVILYMIVCLIKALQGFLIKSKAAQAESGGGPYSFRPRCIDAIEWKSNAENVSSNKSVLSRVEERTDEIMKCFASIDFNMKQIVENTKRSSDMLVQLVDRARLSK
jgi:hypothetical protein